MSLKPQLVSSLLIGLIRRLNILHKIQMELEGFRKERPIFQRINKTQKA